MRCWLAVIALFCAFVRSDDARAWGDLGHEIVCQIAFEELPAAARRGVRTLMARDAQFRSYAKSCVFPDWPRIRAKEHYVDLPRDADRVGTNPCGTEAACVITAILNDIRDFGLNDTAEGRLLLLKTLGHWVGDIHQPLHVSFADDLGGNAVSATGECDANNLHSIWDTCIILKKIGGDAAGAATSLRAEITDEDRAKWVASPIDLAAVVRWANESFEIARSPAVGYCVQKGGECWYADNRREWRKGEPQREVAVDSKYLDAHVPIVRQRLKMAGVRLGAVLKQVLTDKTLVEIVRPHRPWPPVPSEMQPVQEGLDATLWVQTAPEYTMSTAQAYALAAIRLDDAIKDEKWTAIPAQMQEAGYEKLEKKAVIVDIDETVLDNSAYQGELIAGNTESTDALWNRWAALERAKPVRGALEFLRKVRESGVAVFFVTNRSHAYWQSTVRNLKQVGFPIEEDGSNLLSTGKQPGWGPDKEPRRMLIARDYRVLLLLGDDLNDFVTGVRGAGVTPDQRREVAERHASYWGTKWIVVPNPMYGSWEPALYGSEKPDRKERILRKVGRLNRF